MSVYDMNGDGTIDAMLIDSYGDGAPDIAAVDGDQNGVFEQAAVDSNNDGIFDTLSTDANQDGYYEAIGVDANQDGSVDQWILDNNANLIDDATEVLPDPSMGVIGGNDFGGMTIEGGTETGATDLGPTSGTVGGPTYSTSTGNPLVDAIAHDLNSDLVNTGVQPNPDIDGDSYPNSIDYAPDDRTQA